MSFPAHLRATLALGLPLIGGHLAEFAIGLTDTVMLGWYGVEPLAAAHRDIVSRLDRDKLGRPHFSRGVVHVFVVGSLADVDGPGEIRGVHWRDRANTARRWVILSSIAGSLTLTHELGHFFSLPHSRYAGSLMNKQPGGPPFAERRFHAKEAAKMRRAKAAMIGDGTLVPRAAAKPAEPGPAAEP